MADFSETRVREIVRDEMTNLHLNERLTVIETKIDQKADKTDLDKLESKLINEIGFLKIEMASFKEYSQNNFKFIIGFFLTILAGIIAIAFKS